MDFDPFGPAHAEDPHPVYRALRDADTLHWSPEAQVFCATRYDEVASVFKQPELFSSRNGMNVLMRDVWSSVGPRDLLEMVRFFIRARLNPIVLRSNAPPSIISSDPPEHDPLRHMVNRGFTPRRISAWEPRIRELSEHCVSGLEDAQNFDVIAALAHPLPMTIIAEMLGVDSDRLSDFRRWSNGLVRTMSGSARSRSPADMLANMGEMLAYLRTVIERRRANPGDDLISVLVDPTRGEVLDTQGVMMFASILLLAGNETTTSAIGNSVALLLEDRNALEQVTADPSLIPALVEESLRLESPVQLMPRIATRDTTLRNTPIPKGSVVLVMIGAANRDERRFEDPDRLDLGRDTSGHLAFGHGIHFCLGASLARLEARVALETLVPLLQHREIAPHGALRTDSYLTRSFSKLELARIAVTAAA